MFIKMSIDLRKINKKHLSGVDAFIGEAEAKGFDLIRDNAREDGTDTLFSLIDETQFLPTFHFMAAYAKSIDAAVVCEDFLNEPFVFVESELFKGQKI